MYINWKQREIIITVALYGPAGSGKSTAWRYWSQNAVAPLANGDDMFSLRLEDVQKKRLVLQMRDIPGAKAEAARRRVALYGVDGLIFVVDSTSACLEANRLSLAELEANLDAMNKSIHSMPILLQYNKRDLPDALPTRDLQNALNAAGRLPYQETCAIRGEGLVEVLQQATDLILLSVL